MKAPDRIETARLLLRKPRPADAGAIFTRYAGDFEVTKYVGWPAHRSVDDARAFLAFSDEEWARWPAGPYLVESRADGALLGGTGLGYETPFRASTGYIFAKDAWGHGYATEALQAMAVLARNLSLRRLYAICHVDHRASAHVLEKCGFTCEGTLRQHGAFPNLGAGEVCDVLCYAIVM
ncbi:MAG TPA: GNAT family N-acetyltransferase [Vicinamibacterales bacterium]|nr:GNAT family N-acetyltransferase [Vicinamibacterales bacterium]